jgi:Tfp pilus assembly protein PilF
MQAALHVALAFAHIEAGNDQLAREFMAQAMEALPYYSTSYVKKSHFFKHPDDLERLLEALRKAGMPE